MKTCSRCQEDKPLNKFYKTKRSKDGHQPACKICMREAYNNTRNKKKDHYRTIQHQRERANVARYNEWKAQRGCQLCPEREPCALEPHHLDPNEKDFNVSDKSRHMSWERLTEELNKCILVCRNCHSKIHAGIIKTAECSAAW